MSNKHTVSSDCKFPNTMFQTYQQIWFMPVKGKHSLMYPELRPPGAVGRRACDRTESSTHTEFRAGKRSAYRYAAVERKNSVSINNSLSLAIGRYKRERVGGLASKSERDMDLRKEMCS